MILYFRGPAELMKDILSSSSVPFKDMGDLFLLYLDAEQFIHLAETFPPDVAKRVKISVCNEEEPLKAETLIRAGFNSVSLDEFLEDHLFKNLSYVLGNSQVYFHAIIDVKRGKIYGFEALTRMPIPIYKLFKISDRIALLADYYARENVLLEFTRKYYHSSYHLFLNFHPKFLKNPLENVGEILASLNNKDINPSRIVVEIDEYEGMDIKSLKLIREFLKAEGVKVALDDVGAGYSGLYQLTEIHPDIAKLYMGLIRDVHKHPVKQSILAGLVAACRSAGIRVLAEGVETIEELSYLVSLDIDLVQGFLFAKPDPYPNIKEIEELARNTLSMVKGWSTNPQ